MKRNPWIPAKAVRVLRNKHGQATRLQILAPARTNVAAGFYDDAGFHPIRASYDYDPARAGEGRRKRKAAPRKRRKAAGRRRRRR